MCRRITTKLLASLIFDLQSFCRSFFPKISQLRCSDSGAVDIFYKDLAATLLLEKQYLAVWRHYDKEEFATLQHIFSRQVAKTQTTKKVTQSRIELSTEFHGVF